MDLVMHESCVRIGRSIPDVIAAYHEGCSLLSRSKPESTTHTSTSLLGVGVPFTREPNQMILRTSGRLSPT